MQAYKSKRARTLHGTKSTALVGHVVFQARRIIHTHLTRYIYIILIIYIYIHTHHSHVFKQGDFTLLDYRLLFHFLLYSLSLLFLFFFFLVYSRYSFLLYIFRFSFCGAVNRVTLIISRQLYACLYFVYLERIRNCFYLRLLSFFLFLSPSF